MDTVIVTQWDGEAESRSLLLPNFRQKNHPACSQRRKAFHVFATVYGWAYTHGIFHVIKYAEIIRDLVAARAR